MHEKYVNKSKRTLETVAYRNERAMKFDQFVTKYTQAVDELEKRNWGLHNADVIDFIWNKMMNPELIQYFTALKMHFQQQPRDYQKILQDIYIQVTSLHVPNFRKAS